MIPSNPPASPQLFPLCLSLRALAEQHNTRQTGRPQPPQKLTCCEPWLSGWLLHGHGEGGRGRGGLCPGQGPVAPEGHGHSSCLQRRLVVPQLVDPLLLQEQGLLWGQEEAAAERALHSQKGFLKAGKGSESFSLRAAKEDTTFLGPSQAGRAQGAPALSLVLTDRVTGTGSSILSQTSLIFLPLCSHPAALGHLTGKLQAVEGIQINWIPGWKGSS